MYNSIVGVILKEGLDPANEEYNIIFSVILNPANSFFGMTPTLQYRTCKKTQCTIQ